MLLVEFFGKPINIDKELRKNRNDDFDNNELFWFIIDHDKLHRDYFHPLAKKIYHGYKNKNLDKKSIVKEFMPMVKKGCMEFYHKNKLPGHFADNFNKDLMKELCEKLYDHYREDIINDKEYAIIK
jgi:hypothetical protein